MPEKNNGNWTDARLDDLADRVGDIENTQEAISRLPERVAHVDAMAESARDVARATRTDVQDLRREMTAHFDRVHTAQRNGNEIAERTEKKVTRPLWREVLDILMPIAAMLAVLYGTIYAASNGLP